MTFLQPCRTASFIPCRIAMDSPSTGLGRPTTFLLLHHTHAPVQSLATILTLISLEFSGKLASVLILMKSRGGGLHLEFVLMMMLSAMLEIEHANSYPSRSDTIGLVRPSKSTASRAPSSFGPPTTST